MRGAAVEGLSLYGSEVYSFLCMRVGNETDAHEVYAQLSEDLWRGIGAFEWRCSFRTWLYTLARNAAVRFERAPASRAARRIPLSRMDEVAAAAERSRTRPYLRTDVKDRFAALRSSLSRDEQSLLVLRVDRGLSWQEVARVLHDGDENPDDAALRRGAVNLRQRFQQVKERLRALARASGILDEDGD